MFGCWVSGGPGEEIGIECGEGKDIEGRAEEDGDIGGEEIEEVKEGDV